jgi:hypothetical protein
LGNPFFSAPNSNIKSKLFHELLEYSFLYQLCYNNTRFNLNQSLFVQQNAFVALQKHLLVDKLHRPCVQYALPSTKISVTRVSIMFILFLCNYRNIFSNGIPLSRSKSLLSELSHLFSLSRNNWQWYIILSTKVVLPWSTWAIIAMFLIDSICDFLMGAKGT